MAVSLQQENTELKQRLRTFGAIMHLTKDAFAQKDVTSLGVHIVNNTKALLQFDRSLLLDMQGGKAVLTAEYALSAMNEHTQYAVNMKKFAQEVLKLLPEDAGNLVVEKENETGKLLMEKIPHVMESLFAEMKNFVVVPLRSARNVHSVKEPFLWILEYKEDVPRHVTQRYRFLREISAMLFGVIFPPPSVKKPPGICGKSHSAKSCLFCFLPLSLPFLRSISNILFLRNL
jgi:hypothetical protein